MLSCKHIVDLGTDYLDQELGFWKKTEMKMHLMICRHCRRYMKQLKQTIAMLSRWQLKQPTQEQLEQLKSKYQQTVSEG
ncbi:zf-HC2 domain-containing protein [Kangiella spongicola]|uniref:Anti-sigma factor n=1 Tax=Kangiella spongicola TaxID=796379 RepID=A0A318D874_9GAMM|nr:zf-HC2 domain-containing protein [Kangiella spongicola]MBV34884.1 anti-sigma factor [Rickettsiales bacterium]PXF64115.1 anti-sigma factor [Kangiella spongicola]